MGVGVLMTGWRENVEANLASDEWLGWVGGAALFWLVVVCVYGVVQAWRPPDDFE